MHNVTLCLINASQSSKKAGIKSEFFNCELLMNGLKTLVS